MGQVGFNVFKFGYKKEIKSRTFCPHLWKEEKKIIQQKQIKAVSAVKPSSETVALTPALRTSQNIMKHIVVNKFVMTFFFHLNIQANQWPVVPKQGFWAHWGSS